MSYKYRYTGENRVIFSHIRYNDQTFAPNPGDEIVLDTPIEHPLLKLIEDQKNAAPVDEVAVKEPIVKPALPDQTESPAIADDIEEN